MDLAAFRSRFTVETERVGGADWPLVDAGGAGPVLVLLPGMQGTCEIYFKQFAAFAGRMRLVSVWYPAEPDAARLADGLARLLAQRGVARASVLGSSFGGYVAQMFVARHPGIAERLVLSTTFVDASPLQSPAKLAAVREAPAETFKAQLVERLQGQPDGEVKAVLADLMAERQPADNLKARALGVQLARAVGALPIADERITIIDCDNDPVVPAAMRAAVRAAYPGATAFEIKGGGHYPYILRADSFNDVLAARLT